MGVVSTRIPDDLKKEAIEVFEMYGLDWSSAIRMILTQVVSDRAIPVNLNRYSEITPELRSSINKSMKEYQDGNYQTFNSVDDFMESLEHDA